MLYLFQFSLSQQLVHNKNRNKSVIRASYAILKLKKKKQIYFRKNYYDKVKANVYKYSMKYSSPIKQNLTIRINIQVLRFPTIMFFRI